MFSGAVFDFRLAYVRALRTPRFVILSSCCLAAAIVVGGTVSAVGDILLPFSGARDAAHVYPILQGNIRVSPTMSIADFRSLESSHAVAGALAATVQFPAALASQWGRGIERVQAVSGSYFEVRGLQGRLGRLLSIEDDTESRQVVVLSEQFWRARANTSADVLGRELLIAGQPFTVVGVVEGAAGASQGLARSSAWIPLSATASLRTFRDETGHAQVDVMVRPAGGVLAPQLNAQVSRVSERLDAEAPLGPRVHRQWSVSRSLESFSAARSSLPVVAIGALAALFVVITACVTVVNLTLARAAERSGERFARHFLGATWNRLMAPEIIESSIALILGAGLGWMLLASLLNSASLLVPLDEFADTRVGAPATHVAAMAAGIGLALAAAIVVLWPALLSARRRGRDFFNTTAPISLGSAGVHARLIAWQTGATVALSLLALMCLRAIAAPSHSRGWHRLDRSAVALLSFTQNGVGVDTSLRMTSRLTEALARAPLHAAAFSALPVDTASKRTISDPETGVRVRAAIVGMTATGPDVIGLRLIGGAWPSAEMGTKQAVITRTLAEMLFHGLDTAIGRDLDLNGNRYAVLGICDSAGASFGPDTAAYVPLRDVYAGQAALVVSGPSAGVALTALRDELRTSWPWLVAGVTGTAGEVVGRPFYLAKLMAVAVAVLSVTTLVLALVGLHGVCSQAVTSRFAEIGVRTTCGANRRTVARDVVFRGLIPVMKGVVAGTAFAWLVPPVTLAITSIQIETPGLFASLVLGVTVVAAAMLACGGPAYRASCVDPSVLLRQT
jgi:ABC-type antimicrobial peptide transport system permease subunit